MNNKPDKKMTEQEYIDKVHPEAYSASRAIAAFPRIVANSVTTQQRHELAKAYDEFQEAKRQFEAARSELRQKVATIFVRI